MPNDHTFFTIQIIRVSMIYVCNYVKEHVVANSSFVLTMQLVSATLGLERRTQATGVFEMATSHLKISLNATKITSRANY